MAYGLPESLVRSA